MSTPTSKAGLLALVLALSGCIGGAGGTGGGGVFSGGAARDVTVTSDRIVVAGPEGFCVDPTATRQSGDTGFVLLGNCAAISNSRRDAQPAVPAVLTAAISGPGQTDRIADNLGGMEAFFRSAEGRELLSRSGRADAVTVLDTGISGDAFLLHAEDRSAGAIDGVQSDYWRAYMDVGNRIATLSVLGLEGQALSPAQSQNTLNAFIAAVERANSAPMVDRPPPAPAQPPRAAPTGGGGQLWNIGLFRRILG